MIRLLILKIKLVLKKIEFFIWRLKTKLRYILNHTQGDMDHILWINPDHIKKVGIGWGNYNRLDEMGKVKSGDWDLNTMPFENFDIYQSLKQRLLYNKKWEDLPYYKSNYEKILNGETPWGMSSIFDLNKRLINLEKLYFNIKKNGYHSQRQIETLNGFKKVFDEITVRISRNGELLFENGRHRLTIAKILGLSKIPVIVTWRHEKWNNFSIILKNKFKIKNYDLFDNHPEFTNILKKDQRYDLIKYNLNVKEGTLLDLGARIGYFSHKFEMMGLSVLL